MTTLFEQGDGRGCPLRPPRRPGAFDVSDSLRPAPIGSWWETPDGAAFVDGDYLDGPGDQIVTYVLHRRDGERTWGKWGGREFANFYKRLDGPPAWCTSGANPDLTD